MKQPKLLTLQTMFDTFNQHNVNLLLVDYQYYTP